MRNIILELRFLLEGISPQVSKGPPPKYSLGGEEGQWRTSPSGQRMFFPDADGSWEADETGKKRWTSKTGKGPKGVPAAFRDALGSLKSAPKPKPDPKPKPKPDPKPKKKASVTAEVQGSRVYLKGNTYPIKDKLKGMGFHWDKDAKAWWVGKGKHAKIVDKVDAVMQSAPPKQPYKKPSSKGSGGFYGSGSGGYSGGSQYTPSTTKKASPKQVNYAAKLVARAVQTGGWHDSDAGQFYNPPTRKGLEAMSQSGISALIADMKDSLW